MKKQKKTRYLSIIFLNRLKVGFGQVVAYTYDHNSNGPCIYNVIVHYVFAHKNGKRQYTRQLHVKTRPYFLKKEYWDPRDIIIWDQLQVTTRIKSRLLFFCAETDLELT